MSHTREWLAEFPDAEALLDAARSLRTRGCRLLDAFTPMPVGELGELLDSRPSRVPIWMLVGGVLAAAAIYFVQWWAAVVAYPIVSGARPLHSWPAFLVAAFEVGVLGAAVSGVLGVLAGTGLPRLNHRLFAIPGFERASQDRFFLEFEAPADQETEALRAWLADRGAVTVSELAQ